MTDRLASLHSHGGQDDIEEDGITYDMLEEYKEAFELFDKDGDGTISNGELKNLLRCFEVELPDDEV